MGGTKTKRAAIRRCVTTAVEQGDAAIGEIAYAVGFRSVAHFSASFREYYAATPSAYHRSPRGPDLADA